MLSTHGIGYTSNFVCIFNIQKLMHIHNIPSFFCIHKIGALYSKQLISSTHYASIHTIIYVPQPIELHSSYTTEVLGVADFHLLALFSVLYGYVLVHQ